MDDRSQSETLATAPRRSEGFGKIPQIPDKPTGTGGAKKVALVLGRRFRTPGAWTQPDRLAGLFTALLSAHIEVLPSAAVPDPGALLTRPDLDAGVWLATGVVPGPALARVVHERHGVGVWTTGNAFAAGRAISLGPAAIARAAACAERCGVEPGIRALARHLVLDHRIPLAGPRPGLVAWDDAEARAHALLAGKDGALRRLAELLPTVAVDPGMSIGYQLWSSLPTAVLAAIGYAYPGQPVIVRSCAPGEDGWNSSAAGAYESVAVPAAEVGDPSRVAAALDAVFASYPHQAGTRVLVQRWLHPVAAAGVVTTRTFKGAPYYTASIDAESGRTDTVTAGAEQGSSTWFLWQGPNAPALGEMLEPGPVASILAAAAETHACVGTSGLDMELAVVGDRAHLLQARPLPAAADPRHDGAISTARTSAVRQLRRLERDSPRSLLAVPVLLSCMADWNPAEMIGRRPGVLAASLYRTLITDRAWAVQRAEYGYRDLTGIALMHLVAGHAYIDVRASLASFIPAGLDDRLAAAIVRAQAEMLRARPDAHDKLEFEIAGTCWSPLLDARLEQLADAGIGADARARLARALLAITRAGLARTPRDLAALAVLPEPGPQAASMAPAMLVDAARRSALTFAHLARAAFIAADLLRALDGLALLDRHPEWMRTLGTTATAMPRDAAAVRAGRLDWAGFVERYRWVRPGTYDITVPAYGQDPDGYLRPLIEIPAPPEPELVPAPWSAPLAGQVARALSPLAVDPDAFAAFARAAITGREAAKDRYAAWVSALLEALARRGAGHQAPRELLAQLTIDQIKADPSRWAGQARRARAAAAVHDLIELPDVITGASDLSCFRRDRGRPTFIGARRVEGTVCTDPSPARPPAPGSVIVLEAADPGMDWVLALQPAALITAYGGANSHMAIRCAESGVPAAIGVGIDAYRTCAAARRIVLDPGAGRFEARP